MTTIIDTDYDDYAVVYSCTNSLLSGVFHSEYIWVLSRSGKISNPTRQNIYEKLDKLAINRSGLTMSDRSTCPTNSSTVARESESNLAQGVAGAAAPAGAAGADAAAASAPASGAPAAPVVTLEKAGVEPTQKSVVVPLLYDPPSPASSSSVGASKPSVAKAPPAPVDNKVSQLPVASQIKPATQAKPVVAQSPPSPVAASQPVASPASGSSAPVASPAAQPVVNKPSAGSASAQAPQQSLLNKIQPKP